MRSMRVSSAFHTSPIPPSPSGEISVYGPNFWSGVRLTARSNDSIVAWVWNVKQIANRLQILQSKEQSMDLSDGTYVARARGGDSDAFRVLVERHSRSVFRLAFR